MKISVIIPYCQRINALRISLWNLKNRQNRTPDEIIVVDDDNNTQNIDALQNTYQFIHVKTDLKIDGKFRAGHARNIGANIAKNQILVFQDQDMVLGKKYLQIVEEYYTKRNHIATGFFHDIDKEFFKLPVEEIFKYVKEKDTFMNVKMKGQKDNHIAEIVEWLPWVTESRQFAILKSTFLVCGGFDEQFEGWGLEDTEFFYRAKKEFNVRCHKVHGLFSLHLEHEVDPVYMIESMKENAEKFIKKHPESEKKLGQLWKVWNVFGKNKDLDRTYKVVKKIRQQSGVDNFGKMPSMRYFGAWRY